MNTTHNSADGPLRGVRIVDLRLFGEEDLLVKIGYGKLLALDVARGFANALGGTPLPEESKEGEIVTEQKEQSES